MSLLPLPTQFIFCFLSSLDSKSVNPLAANIGRKPLKVVFQVKLIQVVKKLGNLECASDLFKSFGSFNFCEGFAHSGRKKHP